MQNCLTGLLGISGNLLEPGPVPEVRAGEQ